MRPKLGLVQGEGRPMSTWMTIEVEVGVDVSRDVLGMWIAQQLNHQSETVETSPDEEAGLTALDDYQGPITVMWRDRQGEEQA